ncbi:flagellin [Elioraea tepida]|uniref:Flagellin n=1 Tax=Elioraea tepida TaxID=2843330 RepID=A0A975U0Z7_9PROT|nr:flagellin [Elioraea tepida]QXM24302.1 flagellin [Elioraea tepida]
MSSINTNVTAMAAIRSLSMINNAMSKTQASIESGLRINKANDDPAVFAIAQGMRADLKGLTAVRDGLAFGKATLTVARDAATKISNELNTLKQTVTQGQQQGLDKATMNKQVQNLLANMRSFAETATFNGVNLLNNSASGDRELRVLRDITGNTIRVDNQEIISNTNSLLGLDDLDVDQGGIRLTFAADVDFDDGDAVAVTQNGIEYVFEFNTSASPTLTAEASDTRRVIAVDIGDGTSLTPAAELGRLVDAMKANGIGARVNSDGTLDIFGGNVSRVGFNIAGGTPTAGTLEKVTTGGVVTWNAFTDYNVVDGTATASGGSANIAVIGGTLTGATWSNASSAIATVDEAIRRVNTIVAELGARLSQVEGQQEFTKQLTDSIREGLGALVDADLAEESARLTSLQIKQQLAIQSLSIANQQGQALLGLFR